MARLELYHGSERIVRTPTLAAGRPRNDYGRGFYCTQELPLAYEWACKYGRDGYVCRYELEMSGLRMLNLLDSDHTALNWMALLLQNRTFDLDSPVSERARALFIERYSPKLEGFDLIRGYRADDSYFSYAQAFVENRLPLHVLEQALELGELGEQVVLVSERAFAQLHFMEARLASAEKYHPRFKARDKEARRAYRTSMQETSDELEGVYILDLLRRGNEGDADARI